MSRYTEADIERAAKAICRRDCEEACAYMSVAEKAAECPFRPAGGCVDWHLDVATVRVVIKALEGSC